MDETTEEFNPIIQTPSLVSERMAKTGPSREQVMLNAAKIIARELSVILQYDWHTEQLVELTEVGASNWLLNLDKLKKSGIDTVYGLMDHPSNPTMIFHWKQTPFRVPRKEQLECNIPPEVTLEPLLNVFSQISLYFQAFYSHIDNLTLRSLHGRAMRGHELVLARKTPEERQYLSEPQHPQGVTDTLPPLLLPYEFDRVRVPQGVYWINYWSPLQVKTVGMAQIRTANWERLIELPDGGLILAVTKEPLDVTNSEHMAKLGEIVEHLNLKELQERY